MQYHDSMRFILLIALPLVLSVVAEAKALQLNVDIRGDKGGFDGELTVSLEGSLDKAKAKWNGAIRNTTAHRVFSATFCIKAFDDAKREIGKGACVIQFSGNDWAPGESLPFKGTDDIRLYGDKRTKVQASSFTMSASEVFDHALNVSYLNSPCPTVWAPAIRLFAENNFRPTLLDKESLTATYAYEGSGGLRETLELSLNVRRTPNPGIGSWDAFKIVAASLYLREENPGTCLATVKINFAGLGVPFGASLGSWMTVDSNFRLERKLLSPLETYFSQK